MTKFDVFYTIVLFRYWLHIIFINVEEDSWQQKLYERYFTLESFNSIQLIEASNGNKNLQSLLWF